MGAPNCASRHIDDEPDDKGRHRSGPIDSRDRVTFTLALPQGVSLPETSEVTIVEIVVPCRESILELMRYHGLAGRERVVDKTRLNILVEAGRVLGFSTATPLSRDFSGHERVRFDWLFVDPDFRGKGYGRRLWEHMLAQSPSATIVGHISDESGAMERLAKEAGAVPTRWAIKRKPS